MRTESALPATAARSEWRAALRAVVFDLDGTLLHTLPCVVGAIGHVLDAHGLIPVEEAVLRPVLSRGLSAVLEHALDLQPRPIDPDARRALAHAFEAQQALLLGHAQPMPGAAEAIDACARRGLKLAVCSNRGAASCHELLRVHGFGARFAHIVGMGDTARPKPAPDPLHAAMDLLGVAPHETLMVGDSMVDAACARAAGVRFAAFLGGYAGDPAELAPHDLLFDHFDQLIEWIDAAGLASSPMLRKDAVHG